MQSAPPTHAIHHMANAWNKRRLASSGKNDFKNDMYGDQSKWSARRWNDKLLADHVVNPSHGLSAFLLGRTMTEIRVSVDDSSDAHRDGALMNQLVELLRELAPDEPYNISLAANLPEVTVKLHAISEAHSDRFVERVVELSRATGRVFTVTTMLDDAARRAQLKRFPDHIVGDGYIIHVRSTEAPALHAYFRYLFGAP